MAQAQRKKLRILNSSLLKVIAISVVAMGSANTADAADRTISAGTSSFDCSSASPGDTITLAAGARGPLTIKNCRGNSSSPIVIKNDTRGTGPTIIRRTAGTSGGFIFTCDNCGGVVIDGTGKWQGAPARNAYGIKVTMTGGGSPSAFLKLSGITRFVTVRGVEVDGVWPAIANNGIGISMNDHSVSAAANPGVWYEGLTFEGNYVHDTQGEGMYIGPNWSQGGLPLRNIEIQRNVIENTGFDGIQLKSAIGGTNQIHHNTVRHVGQESNHGQLTGISLLDGTGRIFNNWVERAGDAGIRHFLFDLPQSYGAQRVEIFNNVIIESGQVRSTPGHGIACNGRSGMARSEAEIHHNTIVSARDSGVYVGSDAAGGYIRDNVIADANAKPISAPAKISQENNRTGSATQMAFIDAAARNFHLKASSPARNAGSNQFPNSDFDDVSRPQDDQADQGAFEYNVGEVPSEPLAPTNLTVE